MKVWQYIYTFYKKYCNTFSNTYIVSIKLPYYLHIGQLHRNIVQYISLLLKKYRIFVDKLTLIYIANKIVQYF